MSKGTVWNKGKHNGRGLSQATQKQGKDIPKETADEETLIDSNAGDTGNPIHSVKRMNRENWVERPKRVVPKAAPKNDPK